MPRCFIQLTVWHKSSKEKSHNRSLISILRKEKVKKNVFYNLHCEISHFLNKGMRVCLKWLFNLLTAVFIKLNLNAFTRVFKKIDCWQNHVTTFWSPFESLCLHLFPYIVEMLHLLIMGRNKFFQSNCVKKRVPDYILYLL